MAEDTTRILRSLVATRFGSCVDGSLSARVDLTLVQFGRVLSCVRLVDAARLAAGPNMIRWIGS